MRRNILVLFLRFPMLGQGKTRLAKDIGSAAAVCFQRHSIARLIRNLNGSPLWELRLLMTPDRARYEMPFAPLLPLPQGGGSFGERLFHIFSLFPGANIMIIGSDQPYLEAGTIAHAFKMLGSHHAVIGPAKDGGFYLCGFAPRPFAPFGAGRFSENPFRNIRFSTRFAGADLLRNLKPYKTALLAPMEDVDCAASLKRAKAEALPNCRGGSFYQGGSG